MHGASVLSLVILCLGADPVGNIPEQDNPPIPR